LRSSGAGWWWFTPASQNGRAEATRDLGGVPGLSLGMGCRLFCAPVAEVSTSTAGSLQGHLFSDNGAGTIGERYLAAIREDPRVALYTLYGLANERIWDVVADRSQARPLRVMCPQAASGEALSMRSAGRGRPLCNSSPVGVSRFR